MTHLSTVCYIALKLINRSVSFFMYKGDELSSSSAADLEEYKKMLQIEMRKERYKFLVHLSSQLDCDGHNGGSRITTWVDRNMHTLEESRRELVVANGGQTPFCNQNLASTGIL